METLVQLEQVAELLVGSTVLILKVHNVLLLDLWFDYIVSNGE